MKAREPQRHLESDLAYERRVFNRPADYYRSYGHRHNLPALSKVNWREGLIWRWNTADVQVSKGHGVMACYLARLPFWQRIMRRLFETYHAGEWREQESPKLLPTEDKEFRYPPGLDLSAFWFRLDTESGPRNPRDPGFEWAWEKPLLPVEQVQQRWGMVSPSDDT